MGADWLRRWRGRSAGAGRVRAPRTGGHQVSLPFAAQGFVVLVCLALVAMAIDHVWRERDGRLWMGSLEGSAIVAVDLATPGR